MELDRDQQQQQQWRIRLTSKAKRFRFRFRFRFAAATNPSTLTISFFRFSILLNLPNFLFTITSHPTKQPPPSFITSKFNKFITSKFKKFFSKFRPRNKPNIAATKTKTSTSSNLFFPIQWKDTVQIGKKYSVRIGMMVFFVAMVYYLFYYFNFNFHNNYSYNYWEFMGRSMWNKLGSSLKLLRG
ncbi:unnamed protein product [Trifolium pratense]|uniref:Uncharacterized protein n=1 Tax=Trifolium pratense TaxID=57577 RepID=A0ACB0LPE9_TRIPR|nr:unnamed protein product [Trifolium pratense]